VAKLGRAVFFGALTTAVGFLALVLSGAMSFSQLGVLIAIGIFVAGLFMCSILFLFVREGQAAVRSDWLFDITRKYVRWTVRKPAPMLIFSGAVLLWRLSARRIRRNCTITGRKFLRIGGNFRRPGESKVSPRRRRCAFHQIGCK
jgi:hypothetical protein